MAKCINFSTIGSCPNLSEEITQIDSSLACYPKQASQLARTDKNLIRLPSSKSQCAGLIWTYEASRYEAGETKQPLSISSQVFTIYTDNLLMSNLLCQDGVQMTIYDPIYRSEKRYEGYFLGDFLDAIPDVQQYHTIRLIGADGYYSEISLDDPEIRGGFLAFRDLSISECREEGQLWTVFPPRSNGKLRPGTPGPLYLVWSKDHPYWEKNYWPYQVITIELSKAKIKTVALDPKLQAGLKVFQEHCIRCHSAPGYPGGRLGPNLGTRTITVQMAQGALENFIAGKNRPRLSAMPNFGDPNSGNPLSSQQISNVAQFVLSLKK